jgi:hypothetical protein
LAPSWMEQGQEGRPPPARWVQNKLFLHQSHNTGFSPTSLAEGGEEGGYFEEEYEDDYEEEAEEQNEMNFFSPSLLSHVSVQLRDRVERDSHIKGGIPWPQSFTGRDIIVSARITKTRITAHVLANSDYNTIFHARIYENRHN